MDSKVIVALGSNLDEPAQNLALAAAELAAISSVALTCSSIWTSTPEGFIEQVPDFCNAVVAMDFAGEPLQLLARLHAIEESFGRRRVADRYLSRRLDLDLIDWKGELINLPQLALPHPRAFARRFVLLPLQEIVPDFRFPDREESLDDLIKQAPDNPMVKTTRLIPSV